MFLASRSLCGLRLAGFAALTAFVTIGWAPSDPTEFSDFAFGNGVPFAGGTTLDGVVVALTSTQTEPFSASSFRDNLSLNPASVDFVFSEPISEFHLDVSFVRMDEFLTDFNIGSPSSLSGTLVENAGKVTTSGLNDNGFGRLSWFGLSTLTVSFTIDADGTGSFPALAVNRFGLRPGPTGGGTPYCTPKTSSAGCVACIGSSSPGSLPTSGAGDYSITATGVQGGKNGLLFVSLNGRANIPFSGGSLCVTPPTKRGPIQPSGGTTATSCDGGFATLVNDGQIIPSGLDAGPGNRAWYQYWYRDPQNGAGSLGTALSDAFEVEFQ